MPCHSSPRRPRWAIPLLLLATSLCPALEIEEGAAWVDREHTSAWVRADLAAIRFDLKRLHEIEVEVEHQLLAHEPAITVTIVDAKPRSLRAVLADLEDVLGVVAIARAGQRLRILTEETAREEHGVKSLIDIKALGLNRPADFAGPALGMIGVGDGGGFDVFGGGEAGATDVAGALGPPGSDVIGREATRILDAVEEGLESVTVRLLPSRVAPLQQRLVEISAPSRVSIGTRTSFLKLPADARIPTGVVDAAGVAAIKAAAGESKVLLARGRDRQQVCADDLRQINLCRDSQIETGTWDQADPVIEVLNLGRVVDLRAMTAGPGVYLDYRIGWLEQVGEAQVATRVAPRVLAGNVDLSASSATTGGKKDDAGDATTDTDLTGSIDPAVVAPGSSLVLDLPRTWSFRPRGAVTLLPGQFLVLAGRFDETTNAVIVLEVLP